MKKITVGILAHVDSGKTTLMESLLYQTGTIRRLGRVDHGDSYLDDDAFEREHGITVFSKMVHFSWKDTEFTVIDTPGHTDFSSEMERCLQVLDYAVLVVSGKDGVQANTRILSSILEKYRIPCFVFISKMDISFLPKEEILSQLTEYLGPGYTELTEESYESVAMLDEEAFNEYLDTQSVTKGTMIRLIQERKLFPCIFGSAMKLMNVDDLLDALNDYTAEPGYLPDFSARVFKISRDGKGNRLTFAKILGGKLTVRDEIGSEKISQIRIYNGSRFEQVNTVTAGDVCALTGLENTKPGEGLGEATEDSVSYFMPAFSYSVRLQNGLNEKDAMQMLRELEEEEPQLEVFWNAQAKEIRIMLQGTIQADNIICRMRERFGADISFENGSILYKETICDAVEGVGHYEPLKHYAEVHLLLEPLERNRGLEFICDISQDELAQNWQNLILTHLKEKQHLGVLLGAPLSDVRISLLAGKAHEKHTEGGDFREATYRAVRQGLMKTRSLLLEPEYEFTLEVPEDCIGRALNDLHMMGGKIEPMKRVGSTAVISGRVPVSQMTDYQKQLAIYSSGRGCLSCVPCGYVACGNQEEIVNRFSYSPQADLDNSPDSIFCVHGAGVVIPWNEVDNHCHVKIKK